MESFTKVKPTMTARSWKPGHVKSGMLNTQWKSEDGGALIAMLKDCTIKKDLSKGSRIHTEISNRGLLNRNIYLGNTLINMYCKCNALTMAHQVFSELTVTDVVSWTTLITGYAQWGLCDEALSCFEKMIEKGFCPNSMTFTCVLKACGNIDAFEKGEELHAEIERRGLLQKDTVLSNALLDMYAKCGLLNMAQHIFYKLHFHDIVSWNTLIAGYVQHEIGSEALRCFKRMCGEGFSCNLRTFACILKASGLEEAINEGKRIHAEILSDDMVAENCIVANSLINMYVKCGMLTLAQKTFDQMECRDTITWTTLLTGYVELGHFAEALNCFQIMQDEGVGPNVVTFISILKACGNLHAAVKGKEIHKTIIQNGLLRNNTSLCTALMDMYVKCGTFQDACQVFEELPAHDVISWNTLIAGYVQHGYCWEVVKCFQRMKYESIFPDKVTYVYVCQACCSVREVPKGKQIHAQVLATVYLVEDSNLGTALVDMYAKCGALSTAHQLLNELPFPNIISWNALINGYAIHGKGDRALFCLAQIQNQGLCPDDVTFLCALKACGITGAIKNGEHIYAGTVGGPLPGNDAFLGTSLLHMYARCGELSKARNVFNKLPEWNLVNRTALMDGYAQWGQGEETLKYFEKMVCEGLSSDALVFACTLRACGNIGEAVKGKEIHAEIARGCWKHVVVLDALVEMYAKCGELLNAQEVFDLLPSPTLVSANSLIAGYVQHGYAETAMSFFDRMKDQVLTPDITTFIYILKACSSMGTPEKGAEIHANIIREGHLAKKDSFIVSTALIDMYANCGFLSKALEVLDDLEVRDVVSWTTLIAGYAKIGQAGTAFNLFSRMTQEGITPDSITFTVMLKTCCYSGLVDKGQHYFENMCKHYGIVPIFEHQMCMVKLYGFAAHFDKATTVIKEISFLNCVQPWIILLRASYWWGNSKVAILAFEHALC